MDILDIFANNLKFYRADISAVERKKKNISIKNIEKIAKALEVEPYMLLKKEESNDSNA